MIVDEVYEAQFTNHQSYDELLQEDFKYHVKQYVDWFLIQYRPSLARRCRVAAMVSNLSHEAWEDLLGECHVEAYRIAGRFDPTKGNLKSFLHRSLWNFPFRDNNIKRYWNSGLNFHDWNHGNVDGDELIEHDDTRSVGIQALEDNKVAIPGVRQVSSVEDQLKALLQHLDMEERSLLQLHYGMGLTKVEIGKYLGRNESTIRSRLNAALGKVKISGTG